MRYRTLLAALAGASLAVLAPVAAHAATANTISNGGFEHQFNGCTGSAGGRQITIDAHSGNYGAYLYATTAAKLSQTFTTTVTSTLTVWFTGCGGAVATAVVDASHFSGTVAGTGCSSTAWQPLTVRGLPAGTHKLTLTTPSGGMVFEEVALTH